ncbi:hypothetical protein DSO57_1021316 [Entomophthora muscae]|uniref:Uncharacterized protein n=1 Tax=Entomophthora muscae TaxID=34485 RepID=A0ACC2T3E0_9FUNG|nr:hypothetical protein DSO57_1021316 [Entomophthora muscae]
MMIHKVKVRVIIDSGPPGKIISSRLLALELDYQEVFGTAGPLTTKAVGSYSSLPLQFGKLIVITPAIVLKNGSYDILIGTRFMTKYRTITNHGNDTFNILGPTIPMYYTGNKVIDLPKKKLHFINMEYADGDIPIAYTPWHRKLKILPISTKEYRGIPLYVMLISIMPGIVCLSKKARKTGKPVSKLTKLTDLNQTVN